MNAERKAELKKAIGEAVMNTEKEIAQLEARLEPVAPDCSLGRLTRLEAMGEQQVCQHSHDEASKRLTRLKFALTRIDQDAYGICEECEEPIAIERLKIMPESTLCVACATERGR